MNKNDDVTRTVVTATYYAQSIFKTRFNLDEVFDWWIKFDTLYIKEFEDDEEVTKAYPEEEYQNEDFGKYPNRIIHTVINDNCIL